MARRPHSSKQAHSVFQALIVRPDAWRHGYDLLQETQLKSGTLYPLLIRLADDGLLEAEWHPAVPPARAPRHAYRLTQAGLAFARSMLAPASGSASHRIGATA